MMQHLPKPGLGTKTSPQADTGTGPRTGLDASTDLPDLLSDVGISAAPEGKLSLGRIDTQDRLIAAARATIADFGTEGCTVESVSRSAGFTRGAFYSNFSSKDDLFSVVALEEYDDLLARLSETTWEVSPQVHAQGHQAVLRELVLRLLNQLPLGREFYIVQTELTLRSVRFPGWANSFQSANLQFIDRLGEVIEQILGQLGREATVSRRILTNAVIAIVLRSCLVRLSAGDDDLDLPDNWLGSGRGRGINNEEETGQNRAGLPKESATGFLDTAPAQDQDQAAQDSPEVPGVHNCAKSAEFGATPETVAGAGMWSISASNGISGGPVGRTCAVNTAVQQGFTSQDLAIALLPELLMGLSQPRVPQSGDNTHGESAFCQ